MAVVTSVRRHINFLHVDTIIFTRDLLQYGSRVSVDMCLHRLASFGFLKRISFGMYVRHDCRRIFTKSEISDAKKIWLIQRRLSKLTISSPGLILSCAHGNHVENFAPPAVLTDSRTLQTSFVGVPEPSLSSAQR